MEPDGNGTWLLHADDVDDDDEDDHDDNDDNDDDDDDDDVDNDDDEPPSGKNPHSSEVDAAATSCHAHYDCDLNICHLG